MIIVHDLNHGARGDGGLRLHFVGVRGTSMPERDVESLGVMGWGLEVARKSFRRRHHRRRRRRHRPPYR